MQLNERTRDLLIDYIFEKDEYEILDNKYAAEIEIIILNLVNKGKATVVNTSDGDIEEFLKLFSFIEVVDTSMFQLTKYATNLDKVISDTDFAIYKEKEIAGLFKEIKSIEREIAYCLKNVKDLDLMIMSE